MSRRTIGKLPKEADPGECAVAARYENRTGIKVKKTPVRQKPARPPTTHAAG
jgi:hypothetical protein